ncbi:MAG: putative sulfate exporter family transporter [Candidatus Pseudobacter hemicellulosilyticus]|uniref:Sulfate exporter family transporter n=1 Tax=Candidatus Pseudobacter hemicellulosilyticus TaxID=3121375 RepID=A0AAJ6BFX8_9BACT|nr:MAG: putative sulfate exporter family transporter [Pseudobacter sp.]
MDNKAQFSTRFKQFLSRQLTFREIIFITMLLVCLSGLVSAPLALLLGILVAQFIGHPFLALNHKATHILLQVSVVGLGFGIHIETALQAGKAGFAITIVSIFGTLFLGYLLGKILKVEKITAYLIAAGTAICGGSAIAALSPVIKAEEKQISVALGTIFILNALALFLFPLIGQALQLSQWQFGIWSAIAIQDTSSVVGAASKYGKEALQVASTVKLTRALWIIPIAFGSALVFKAGDAANANARHTPGARSRIKLPYFIGLFVVAILLNSYIPVIHSIADHLVQLSRAGLTVTLFLIGSGLSRKVLSSVGFRPVVQGALLWILISAGALWAVMALH